MPIAVGLDIAKEFHWVCIVDGASGEALASHRVDNEPEALDRLVAEIQGHVAERGPARVGMDVVGGIAALAACVLHEAGLPLVHVPGLAVNRARQGTTGGERKSDPAHAAVIAEQVRVRAELRPIEPLTELDAEIRLLVGRWRDLLASIHPGLEPRRRASAASGARTSWRPPPGWRRCSGSRERSAAWCGPAAATRRSSGFSTSRPSAR
jgi:hypothetical protein